MAKKHMHFKSKAAAEKATVAAKAAIAMETPKISNKEPKVFMKETGSDDEEGTGDMLEEDDELKDLVS